MSNKVSEELFAELTTANRRYQSGTDALDQAAAELLGINRTDARCIDVILRGGRISAGELAVAAGLSPGAATTAIDRLERAGYARRSGDPDDRRRVIVEPTERVTRLAEEIYGPLADGGRAIVTRFSERQLEAIIEFLGLAAELQLERANEVRAKLEGRA
jgi:DNA-binding MarR family transcriptional regulator